ncbi:MAG: hypothetical protein EXR98_02775 [Gemmataceae bacterium]|nr:hypothetical protein [Gemmataceae bacterium]
MKPEPAIKSKPFPWRCPRCLEKSVHLATIPYTAQGRGDGQLHVVEIPALRIPQCNKCGELVFTESVDEQIQEAMRARRMGSVPVK